MRLDTPRYVLRDFSPRDRDAFVSYHADARYRRLYGLGPDDDTAARELFGQFDAWRRHRPRLNFQLGIFSRRDGRLCGCAGVRSEGLAGGQAGFGIELSPDEWGRFALAIETASAMIEFAFDELNLETLLASTSSGNARADKLARWFGARIIDRRSGPHWMTAQGWNEVDWALSRAAWASSPARLRLELRRQSRRR